MMYWNVVWSPDAAVSVLSYCESVSFDLLCIRSDLASMVANVSNSVIDNSKTDLICNLDDGIVRSHSHILLIYQVGYLGVNARYITIYNMWDYG